MGKNKQPKQQTMKDNRPVFRREKRRDKDAFGKKTYTANDFLKDEFISCLHQRPQKDEDTPSDSDWVELSDDGRDFLSNRKQPRETAEDGACPRDEKKMEVLKTAKVGNQKEEEEEEEEEGPGADGGVSTFRPSAVEVKLVAMGDEGNRGRSQTQSHPLVSALMTSVSQAVVSTISDVHHVDVRELLQRSHVLSSYLSDGRKQLEALWALEDILDHLERPHNVLQLLFDVLFDEAIVDEDTFYRWKVDAERRGRTAALLSVADFFTWLQLDTSNQLDTPNQLDTSNRQDTSNPQ